MKKINKLEFKRLDNPDDIIDVLKFMDEIIGETSIKVNELVDEINLMKAKITKET